MMSATEWPHTSGRAITVQSTTLARQPEVMHAFRPKRRVRSGRMKTVGRMPTGTRRKQKPVSVCATVYYRIRGVYNTYAVPVWCAHGARISA